MGIFGKKQAEQPVNRDRVRAILKSGMKERDEGDSSDCSSAEFRKALNAFDKAVKDATPAERRAAMDALRRNGY